MTGQPRIHSLAESLMNILIGFFINLVAQMLIFPAFGAHFTFTDNLRIGAIFTAISLMRSYFLRRFFNWIMIRSDII